ncbi:Gfo/Idh/MocA family protein [Phenylobacterium deserti]|uniref:Gfo/Idh/MocA family oxidoreductase n=1 Tax=Phenylobacterium deserti TaxID=1914756 RepID=A0A328A8F9_9CAUL|nr:Gfo/Idh/MocA family oxidoreductase [Phenylobacterium deserti]RAK50820.1 gfo/Idh/MocA family oxidoreductase [Phenylobacterium deserti]
MTQERGPRLDRRAVVGGAAALTAVAAGGAARAAAPRRKYAIVGTGHRSRMFQDAIWGPHKDASELVAVCDLNPGRVAYTQRRSREAGAKQPRGYVHTDFERMIRETKPETIIVTTVDATHDNYIVRALEAGCDVITEKPMTTTAAKAQRIIDACQRTGRNIRVTFNYRYSPPRTQIKDLLMSGEIGDVLSVDFNWLLNTNHGADYFRRWHSNKANSGGLMVHKATHHFDLVNWWLSALPQTVWAYGKREFYTPTMAKRLGLKGAHERCRTCPEKDKCSFYLDLAADPSLKALYIDNEKYDGYFRDQCVWRPEINIEDTMNVIVKYDTGATLSYSLNACNAWEGYNIAFNGTKGRIEHSIVEQVYVAGGDMVQGGIQPGGVTTRVMPLRGAPRIIEPWTGTGGHGGGDDVMLADIFAAEGARPDKYFRVSDQNGGAYSILIGAAANRCFETGGPVNIAEMATGLRRPAYAPMPTRNDPVPMPPRKA